MRKMRKMWRAMLAAAVQSALMATALYPRGADAASVTWIGGNADWLDGGAATNWNPNDEPESDDIAVFNTANSVNLGSNNAVAGLTLSGGIDLFTNAFDLSIDGLVQVAGAGTNLLINDAASALTADDLTINADGTVELRGGTLALDEEAGTSLVDINVGGNLIGNGTISFADVPGGLTTVLINDGELTALSRGLTILSPPPVGTLHINTAGPVFTRVDLDGAGEAGVVNVNRNQTIDLNVGFADAFNGTMNLFHESTFDSLNGWTLAGGSIVVNNGFVDNPIPTPDIPAGTAFIKGGTLTQSGGTINVVDTDGTLQFDAAFVMNGGTFNNQGHTIFNANATVNAAAIFTMGPSGSDLTVGANADVLIDQASFNLDGNAAGTVVTVNQGGALTLDLGDYDNDAATNAFDATIILNRGSISIATSDAEFVMNGALNMDSVPGNFAIWSGEPLDIGNDLGTLDADVNVTGSSTSQFGAQVDFNSDADVNVAAGATLMFVTNATVNFNTVNGANNAEFTGAGSLVFNLGVNVNEAVTFNMTGGTVDLDGTDSVGDLINIDAPFTIGAATISSFGRVNGGGGTNTLDINNSIGTGVLTVNLDSASAEWTLNAAGVMNLVNDNTEATLLAGSDVNLNGTVNVTGDVRTTARIDFGSTAVVNIITAAQPLRLAGGADVGDPNTIAGGTISGAGLLGADTGKALQGFGTINTGIDFEGTADLLADNGTLTINGAIVDAGQVGTADVDGTLHVTNAWNNNVTTGVQLNGGTLSGGTITNDVVTGISGHGLVTARVINNTQLFASIGDTLIFQTGANDNDWDGSLNAGEIEAVSANIELRDVGAAFGFTGTVRATNNHTAFANGFALDFNPGSTLALASGGTYRSTQSTDIGGTVSVGVSESTIQVSNNSFLTFEPTSVTTLNANLRLVNNNINIEAGATFSGAGAIVIPDDSHMVADNLADIGVLLDMQGGFRPGNSQGIGRISLLDYQQANTSELFVELRGTALNAFDRLVASGDVVLDGYLNIDIDEISPGVPFVPALGQTFNIITANTVTGEFDFRDISGMPNGLTFYIDYLTNAVQLQVVNTPFYSADFDGDGDVDNTDLAIWRGAFNLNQLGDANGDNRTDIDDWTLWRDQFGSAPGPLGSLSSPGVPEPTSLGLAALAFGALGLRRRCRGKGRTAAVVAAGAVAGAIGVTAVPTTASAAPTMSVTDNGLVGGNRQWLVQVAPDPALFSGGQGSLAVELGFEVTFGELLSASVNTSAWPFDLPANNSPAGYGVSDGLTVNTTSDRVFAALGSDPFNNGNLVPVLTIVTQGAGAATLTWGDYTVPVPGSPIGARIAQAGTVYNGYQGSLTVGLSDVWDNSSGSGFWSDAVNWADDTEPAALQEAIFPVGFPNGDTTITLAAGENARQLTFHDSYTLAGGALTLSGADSVLHVDVAKTATISSALTANGNLQLSGGGNAVVSHVRAAGGLNLLSGSLKVAPNGGNAGTSRVGSVQPTSARFDLADNKLIVTAQPIGTWSSSVYTGVSGLIDSGRGNASNAQWNGSGIVTSDTRAVNNNDLCSVGVALASQVKGIASTATTTFAGQTVQGDDVVVMFTWGGDANLDGKINIDDYGQIDFNVSSSGSVFGWYNGDFNYDGKINIDDYGIIDFNVSAQNLIFPTAGGIDGVAAVPEPASGISLLGLTAALGGRRCRSARSARR